jgi:hypothetical protein
MSDKQLVIAIFPDEVAADRAALALKDSGTTKGDAVGVLALDSEGNVKQDKVGARSSGKGAAIGGALWLLGPVGIGVGVLGGTAVGAMHHKGLGLTDADKERLKGELAAGKAAVGVLAHYDTVPGVTDQLNELGGQPQAYEITDEALDAAASGTPAA